MGAASPTDRRYLASHEWHKPEGGLVTVGVSQFAVDELTDITFLDIKKKVGSTVKAGESFGEIESVKATSELYSGVAGEVAAVNEAAIKNPAVINQDPYGQGWLIKLKPADASQIEKLLSGADYDKGHS
ncbi:MAG: glycine cleavage system protein GcvH [Planctomycetota bacterium]|nr:glycine cleavage system protein GcvH [Planctomycetota bacterium]